MRLAWTVLWAVFLALWFVYFVVFDDQTTAIAYLGCSMAALALSKLKEI